MHNYFLRPSYAVEGGGDDRIPILSLYNIPLANRSPPNNCLSRWAPSPATSDRRDGERTMIGMWSEWDGNAIGIPRLPTMWLTQDMGEKFPLFWLWKYTWDHVLLGTPWYSGFLYNRGEVINVVMEEKFEILIVVMEIVLIIVVMANSVHHDYTVHTI